jgi:6-phosphogluconolactonase
VSETSPSLLTSLRIEPDGGLVRLSSVPTSGDAACHLAWSPDGRHLVVAHYGSGSVSSVAVTADGQLTGVVGRVRFIGSSPDPERQTEPHAHQVVVDGAELLVADLGTDQLYRLALDDSGQFATVAGAVGLPAGSGPRHLVVVADHLVVACELSGQLWVAVRTAEGWQHVQTVPASGRAGGPAAVPSAIRAHGEEIFVANRGPETVAVFGLDSDEHRLRPIQEFPGGGAEPRDLVVTSDRLWSVIA